MASPSVPAAILLSLALPVAGASDQPPREAPAVQVAQMTFHQHIIIRFPRLRETHDMPPPAPAEESKRWQEKKAPKCVPISEIEGASVTRPDLVDLVMADDSVLRAHFDDRCPALDFYQGFYMRPTADGMVCAGRDSLRSRSGGDCRIKTFKRLVRKR